MRTLLFLGAVLAMPAGAMENADLTYSFKISPPTSPSSKASQQIVDLDFALLKLTQCQESIAKDSLTDNINPRVSHILNNPILAKYVKLLGPRIGFRFNSDHLENIEYHLIKAHVQSLTANLREMQAAIDAHKQTTPPTNFYLIDSGPITLEDFIKCCV